MKARGGRVVRPVAYLIARCLKCGGTDRDANEECSCRTWTVADQYRGVR
jgi:hypothetical protein